MAKVDKILEAEQTIITISEELAKMKSAVELLESTKVKAGAVIKTGESVVKNINTFVEQGTKIVQKIGEYDIKTEVEKIESQIIGLNKSLKDGISGLKKETKEQAKSIKSFDKKVKDKLTELKGFSVKNQEKADQNQQYLYMIIGVNVLLAAAVALKVFGIIN